ncbi:MAG: hypothetical protein U0R19_30505 [Bryobacteraceae bacterium]
MGIVNERHEPPAFNAVERPFVESIIIPTTWRELGFGFTGDLGRRHAGEAKAVVERYLSGSERDRSDLLAFLKSL